MEELTISTSKNSFIQRITGFFTFQKSVIKEVTESTSATTQALILIILDILITAIMRMIAYSQNQDQSILGLGALFLQSPANANDLTNFLNGFLSALLGTIFLTLILSIVMAFAAKNLGGKVSYMEGIRIIAFSTPILIIGSILIYVLAFFKVNGIGWLYFFFLLWYLLIFFIAFKIGSELSYIKTFLALIITLVLIIIILEILFFVLSIFY